MSKRSSDCVAAGPPQSNLRQPPFARALPPGERAPVITLATNWTHDCKRSLEMPSKSESRFIPSHPHTNTYLNFQVENLKNEQLRQKFVASAVLFCYRRNKTPRRQLEPLSAGFNCNPVASRLFRASSSRRSKNWPRTAGSAPTFTALRQASGSVFPDLTRESSCSRTGWTCEAKRPTAVFSRSRS